MKPNVLLAGGSGYIGKNISSAIKMMQICLLYLNIQIQKSLIII